MLRVSHALVALLLGSGCYLAHGTVPFDGGASPDAGRSGRDAGTGALDADGPAPDGGTPPIEACEVHVGFCSAVHDAPIELFDRHSQSPEIVWGPDRLLLAFWAPGEEPADGGPKLLHIDLGGRVLEVVRLTQGYNETHLAWNPRTAQGLFAAESGLTWIDAEGHPTASVWLSPDARFRSTFDVGPTEDGFAVVVSGRRLETQLGTSTTPGEVDWVAAGRLDGSGPAVADEWTGELRALAGGSLLRHDGVAWDPPVDGVEGGDFGAIDIATFRGRLYTLHAHYDGRSVVRRWTLDGEPVGENTVSETVTSGSTRLLAVGPMLAVVSTELDPRAAIVVHELDPDTLEVGRRLFEVAPPPPMSRYNRHSIAVTETPRGLAFVWTEGPVGPSNMHPYLRLYECCVAE